MKFISRVERAPSAFSLTVNIYNKEMLIGLNGAENSKQTHQKDSKNVADSTIWFVLLKKFCTGQYSSTKRPGGSQKTNKVDESKFFP